MDASGHPPANDPDDENSPQARRRRRRFLIIWIVVNVTILAGLVAIFVLVSKIVTIAIILLLVINGLAAIVARAFANSRRAEAEIRSRPVGQPDHRDAPRSSPPGSPPHRYRSDYW